MSGKDKAGETSPETQTTPEPERTKDKPANIAPDAVKDPNEKTDGKPGMGPEGERKPGGEADPGGG